MIFPLFLHACLTTFGQSVLREGKCFEYTFIIFLVRIFPFVLGRFSDVFDAFGNAVNILHTQLTTHFILCIC